VDVVARQSVDPRTCLLLVIVICRLGLRGLDAASGKRADALATRLAAIEDLPVTAGVPRLVLEQLASAAQMCPYRA
jgi:hypothetical protein